MLSHDLAHRLLERRNHDLRFVSEVSFPGADDEVDVCSTQLADDRYRTVHGREAKDVPEVLTYDADDDVLDVLLGPIYAGRQGGYVLDPEEVEMVIETDALPI
jgi:hypothetical protein